MTFLTNIEFSNACDDFNRDSTLLPIGLMIPFSLGDIQGFQKGWLDE